MKLRLLFSTLVGALAIGGASAGEYCPPAAGKCPIECCPDSNGEISIGYHTDYILYGVRHLRDNITADVNYTFDCLPVPVTIGATQITGLGSNGIYSGDESDLYATVELPGMLGFQASAGYIHRMYPNLRGPSGTPNNNGDSRGEVWVLIEREIGCGINVFYRRAYDLNMPSAFSNVTGNATDEGAFVHTLGVEKDLCLTDCIGLSLGAGVLYSDNYWPGAASAGNDGRVEHQRASGWNNYYVKAALPIALNCNATLTPYIGYNGTPDTWLADGVQLNGLDNGNGNDILHGGVTLKVKF